MKKIFSCLLYLLFCSTILSAQSPYHFNYQAVAHNASGSALVSTAISLRISIIDSIATGTVQYVETHNATTNTFGLFTLKIGNGTVVSGSMQTVNWSLNDKFIKIEMDPAGGTNYIHMGTTQLLSVPYALHSANGNWNRNGNDIQNANSGNVQIGTNTNGVSGKLLIKSITGNQNALRIIDSNAAGFPTLRIENESSAGFGKAMWVTSTGHGMELSAKNDGLKVYSDSSLAGYFQNQNTNEATVRIVNTTNTAAANALWVAGGNIKLGNNAMGLSGKLAIKMNNESSIGLHISDSSNLGYPSMRVLHGSSSPGSWLGELLSSQNGLQLSAPKRALEILGTEEAAVLTSSSNLFPTVRISHATGEKALQVEGKTFMGTSNGNSTLEVLDTLSTYPVINVKAGNNSGGKFISLTNNGITGINVNDSPSGTAAGVQGLTYAPYGVGVSGIANGGIGGFFQSNGTPGAKALIAIMGKSGFGTTDPMEQVDIIGNLKISNSGTASTAPTGGAGTMRFNTSNNLFEGWNGSGWTGFGGGSSSFSLPFNSGNLASTTPLFTLKNTSADAMQIGGKTSFNKFGNVVFNASTTVDIDGELRLRDQQNQVAPTVQPGVIRFNNGVFSGYNGSTWLNFGVATGDNWGTQVVQHSTLLSGNGTAASPLSIAQNGASTGQVLQWNGSTWAPATVSGGGSSPWTLNGNDISNNNSGKILMGISAPVGNGEIQMNPQAGPFGLGTKIWTNNSYVNTVYIADSAMSGGPIGCSVCSGNNPLKVYTQYGTAVFATSPTGDGAFLHSNTGNALKIDGKVRDIGSQFATNTGSVSTTTNIHVIPTSFSISSTDIIVITALGGSNTSNKTYMLNFNTGSSQWEIKTKDASNFESNLSFNLIKISSV